jgi:hypothetical protein
MGGGQSENFGRAEIATAAAPRNFNCSKLGFQNWGRKRNKIARLGTLWKLIGNSSNLAITCLNSWVLPMPRPGHPSTTFPAIDSSWRPLLQPPPELTATQRELFAVIVAATKSGHFREADVPLIALYVQALELAQSTGADVARDPGSASGSLLKAYELASRRVQGLSQRLRLSPQARSPNVSGRSADAPRQASYYDRVIAAGGHIPTDSEP